MVFQEGQEETVLSLILLFYGLCGALWIFGKAIQLFAGAPPTPEENRRERFITHATRRTGLTAYRVTMPQKVAGRDTLIRAACLSRPRGVGWN